MKSSEVCPKFRSFVDYDSSDPCPGTSWPVFPDPSPAQTTSISQSSMAGFQLQISISAGMNSHSGQFQSFALSFHLFDYGVQILLLILLPHPPPLKQFLHSGPSASVPLLSLFASIPTGAVGGTAISLLESFTASVNPARPSSSKIVYLLVIFCFVIFHACELSFI